MISRRSILRAVFGLTLFCIAAARAIAAPVSAAIDGAIYRIAATADLTAWTLALTEVIGASATALTTGLPVSDCGWSYRSFHTYGVAPRAFFRANIGSAP